ncbi:MAG: GGDEF domain-containing protein [Lachnospiraceae bacterium]|nr:GGDEF domain-containing protein [Lachnospiraceae bacterium]
MGVKKESQTNTIDYSSDEAYDEILRQWQSSVFRIILYVMVLTFLIEIIFMIVLNLNGQISVPIPQYIPRYILRPLATNIIAYIAGLVLSKKMTKGLLWKEMIPLFLLLVVLSNLMIVHYVFTALYAAIVIPIYLSVIYGDMKVTKRIFLIVQPVYILNVIIILLTPYKVLPENFWYDVIVAYVMMPLSYIIVRHVVEYENKKEQLITAQDKENDELRERMLYDGLTEIYNHTGLFNYLDKKIAAWKPGDQLHMAVLDIDWFKHVNDDFGHEAGNLVLKGLSRLMRGIASDQVLVARYGGEEFSIVFSDMSMDEAMKILKKLHASFAVQSYVGIDRVITFSAGIATYESGMKDRKFFEKADQALYRAKNEGRNRIVIAD